MLEKKIVGAPSRSFRPLAVPARPLASSLLFALVSLAFHRAHRNAEHRDPHQERAVDDAPRTPAPGSEDEATELYHAAKMANVEVGREEMLNWAATYGESDRLEKAVGLGRKGAVGFASKGEYLGSMTRTSSPPRKFEVGTEAARTAYGLPG